MEDTKATEKANTVNWLTWYIEDLYTDVNMERYGLALKRAEDVVKLLTTITEDKFTGEAQ